MNMSHMGPSRCQSPRPLFLTRVPLFLTWEGGHKWGCESDAHSTDMYVARERLLQAGEVRPRQRLLCLFFPPWPPVTPWGLDQLWVTVVRILSNFYMDCVSWGKGPLSLGVRGQVRHPGTGGEVGQAQRAWRAA